MGRQHPGIDGLDTGRRHEESGETRGVEGAGCQVICGAPTVHRIHSIVYHRHISDDLWYG